MLNLVCIFYLQISNLVFTEGDDWIVLVEKYENQEEEILTRKIISLRLVAEHYRRDDEIHDQQLYNPHSAPSTVTDQKSQEGSTKQLKPNQRLRGLIRMSSIKRDMV